MQAGLFLPERIKLLCGVSMGNLALSLKSASQWFKLGSKRGVSAIEYGLLAALIALVIIAAITTLGTNLQGLFQSISAQVHT
jgi:pilus assembly protein Flp/PilA